MSTGRVKTIWRESGRTVRFFFVDGRVMILLLLLLYNWNWWMFGVAVVGILMFMALERVGYTVPNALRKLRVWMIGNHRPAVIRSRRGRSDR